MASSKNAGHSTAKVKHGIPLEVKKDSDPLRNIKTWYHYMSLGPITPANDKMRIGQLAPLGTRVSTHSSGGDTAQKVFNASPTTFGKYVPEWNNYITWLLNEDFDPEARDAKPLVLLNALKAEVAFVVSWGLSEALGAPKPV